MPINSYFDIKRFIWVYLENQSMVVFSCISSVHVSSVCYHQTNDCIMDHLISLASKENIQLARIFRNKNMISVVHF